jgi:hypothetical protein
MADEEKKEEKEKDIKEERIRAITQLYYSNPNIVAALLDFAKDREVVPRYYEGFGKRPDILQYPSDIDGLVKKGATSFHASEELWLDPLSINAEMTPEQLNEKRKSWDLLIDIDSKFLDLSKIAARLAIEALEYYGIKNYGIKFSGSKGFHIIVSGNAFPREYDGKQMKDMFPEWPRAITSYIFDMIRDRFRNEAEKNKIFEKKDKTLRYFCKQCNREAREGVVTTLRCNVCGFETNVREDIKDKKEILCRIKNNPKCPGLLEIINKNNYYFCEECKDPSNEKLPLSSDKYPDDFEQREGSVADEHADFDLVLVAPRHLFRMPYSLHEKTALASIVLKKEEISSFNPKDANPLTVVIRNFLPENKEGEARQLLAAALEWKKTQTDKEDTAIKKKYASYDSNIDSSKINESMFPAPIKKLLLGLADGKKRGLFILITFLRSLNFPPEYVNKRVREWNEKNTPPLKEGYIRSQIDWHLRQRKKILPPNYNNASFYKDLGLLDDKQTTKNPVVDVTRRLRGR